MTPEQLSYHRQGVLDERERCFQIVMEEVAETMRQADKFHDCEWYDEYELMEGIAATIQTLAEKIQDGGHDPRT